MENETIVKHTVENEGGNMQTSQGIIKIIPLSRWNEYYEYPTVNALRQLRFKNINNFNSEVVKCIGKKIYIDPQKFFNWVDRYGAGC